MGRTLIVIMFVFGSIAAQAATSTTKKKGFEVRVGYGAWTQAPKDLNTDLPNSISNYPTLPALNGISGDIIYQPNQQTPVVVGIRYESFSSKTSPASVTDGDTYSNYTATLNASRLAVILGVRQDIGIGHIGLIGTVGAWQSASYQVSATDTTKGQPYTDTYTGKTETSYSAGVEATLYFGPFEIGAEGGYLSYKVDSFTDSTNSTITYNGVNVPANLSGPYAKGFVGFMF